MGIHWPDGDWHRPHPRPGSRRFAARPLPSGGTPTAVWLSAERDLPELDLSDCREIVVVAGHPDDETTEALDKASTPREVSTERSEATVDDLRSAGSQTVAAAERGSLMTKILLGLGVTGGAQQTGALDQAQQVVGKVQAAKGMLDTVHDLAAGLAPYWWVGVLVVGYFAWREYGDVIKHRLNDEKLGLHIGR